MELLSTREVADRLRVTQNEVRRLHASESLTGHKVGGRLLFDVDEVRRLQQTERKAGRPWSTRTAWAAVELLNGEQTTLIDQPRVSRLKKRLRGSTAEQVQWLARGRARTQRFHASQRALGRLASLALPTGDAALYDSGIAGRFGMAAPPVKDRFDGYLTVSLDDAVAQGRLRLDPSGNVILRELPDPNLVDGRVGTDAVIALDLMDSDDVRERSAGRERINELLRAI